MKRISLLTGTAHACRVEVGNPQHPYVGCLQGTDSLLKEPFLFLILGSVRLFETKPRSLAKGRYRRKLFGPYREHVECQTHWFRMIQSCVPAVLTRFASHGCKRFIPEIFYAGITEPFRL